MFQNQTVFQANLVKKGELKKTTTGKSYLQISVAKNYSIKNENGEYENLDAIFVNLTLWDKTAELFDKSDIPNGTPLIIVGTVVGEKMPAYTSANGTEYPERHGERIIVDSISVPLTAKRVVSVSFDGTKTTQSTTKNETKPKQEAAKKATQEADPFGGDDDDDFLTADDDVFGDDDLPF